MRERIETGRGSAWLEAIGEGVFLVFGSDRAEEALGVVVEAGPELRYLWRAWGDDEALMAAARTRTAAVAAVIASAGSPEDAA